jgi:hypothetical protein
MIASSATNRLVSFETVLSGSLITAPACALGLATIQRAELAEDETSMTVADDLAVRRALEAAGVVFIDENGDGPCVSE